MLYEVITSKKEIVLVVNKVDNNNRIMDAQEFYGLGLGEIYCISSMTGSGTGDMLDALVEKFPNKNPLEEEHELPYISVVGRPRITSYNVCYTKLLRFMQNFFVKSHGLGNDYIVMNQEEIAFELTENAIIRICDVHYGIGSDGILLKVPRNNFV